MREIVADGKTLDLGRAGENLVTRVSFDCTKWPDLYGQGGTFTLLVQRPTDPAAYPVTVDNDGGWISWVVTSSDTAVPGYGRAELQYTVDSVLAKSLIMSFVVRESLSNTEEPPDPWMPWVQTVLNAAEVAEDARDQAEDYADDARRAAESVHDYSYSDDGDGNVTIAIVTEGG